MEVLQKKNNYIMITLKLIKNYIKMMNKLNKELMRLLLKLILSIVLSDLTFKKPILIILKKIKLHFLKRNCGDSNIDQHLIAPKIIKLEKED